MELRFLAYPIGFCIPLLVCSCLDVQDHVYLRNDLQLEWSLHLSGSLKDYTSYFEGWDILTVDDSLQEVSISRFFRRPGELQIMDSSGLLGPLRQNMEWHRDSVGNLHFIRNLRVDRDMPGDDGDYADRMLGGLYRGHSCSFTTQLPGRILNVKPKPFHVDSMRGVVRWEIPLAQMIGSPLEMEVVAKPLPTNTPSERSIRFWFLVIAGLVFLSGYPIARWLRRK